MEYEFEIGADSIIELVKMIFKEIAIVFTPQDYSSTEALLQIKAAACADRLLNGKLQRLSF